MAKIKIKEGSLIIEVFDDLGEIVFSHAFPKLNYTTLTIETWEKAEDKKYYRQGKLKKVAGTKNQAQTK